MELSLLDLAIQNDIIMYQRPTYQYIKDLVELHDLWYNTDNSFCETYSNSLILDAIRLQKYFQLEFNRVELEQKWVDYRVDIAMNEIN
ncbi:MAG: hypothetical protein CMI60_21405 [Parvibaculum sp.]|nr:hypothetical protein [Parvibaculum sp.]|tara:strand:+ start:401 stop:664 length:264 start_codon:yes stop_codon:yes gene_type:complete